MNCRTFCPKILAREEKATTTTTSSDDHNYFLHLPWRNTLSFRQLDEWEFWEQKSIPKKMPIRRNPRCGKVIDHDIMKIDLAGLGLSQELLT